MANSPVGGDPHGRNTHTDKSLDLFAAAWLERLNSHGGTVTATSDGRAMVGTMIPEMSSTTQWEDGAHHGTCRELIELARLIPGGREAIAAHVARFPNWIGEGEVSA